MAGKLTMLVGFGAGYVLGARSGRGRYEQMKSKAQEVWNDPRVQEKAGKAQQLVKAKAKEKVSSSSGSDSSNGTTSPSGTGLSGTPGTTGTGTSGMGTTGTGTLGTGGTTGIAGTTGTTPGSAS